MKDSRSFLLLLILLGALAGATVLPALAHVERATSSQQIVEQPERLIEMAPADPGGALEHRQAPAVRRDQARSIGRLLAPRPSAPALTPEPNSLAACNQLLLNPTLDIYELGDGTGTAEPWEVLEQIVYFDSEAYFSSQYSLFLLVGDDAYDGYPADPSPSWDGFAQFVQLPDYLESVVIDYWSAMLNERASDEAYGDIYVFDDQGTASWITGWYVGDFGSEWNNQYFPITDTVTIGQLSGRAIAVVFSNYSESGLTQGEGVWFDDITLTACTEDGPSVNKVFLPSTARAGEPEPRCSPPVEPDSWNVLSTRGYVEVSAVCTHDLSEYDTKDYYSFEAPSTRNFRFHLRNLPAGSEWSLTVFVDQAGTPPIADGGDCRTTDPGDGDKQVTCSLTAGRSYFIKVSAGAYSGSPASYNMQVTAP